MALTNNNLSAFANRQSTCMMRRMLHSPYLRLMRLHQPTGIWLLMWPCWWSAALASQGLPPVSLLLLFALGSVLMRGAGCIINDLADRKFDREVERTRTRPLASGELSPAQGVCFLGLLLAFAFAVAMALGNIVVLWSLLALPPVAIYPWMKRMSWWPQLFLGLVFNWGAIVGWAAVAHEVELPAILLYIGCVFWTLGYDTIYAHQDKEDDKRIGVRSTALRLGKNSKVAIGGFYLLAVIFWALAAWDAGCGILFFALLILAQLQLSWQLCHVDFDAPESCRRIFISNRWLGLLVFIAIVAGHIQ